MDINEKCIAAVMELLDSSSSSSGDAEDLMSSSSSTSTSSSSLDVGDGNESGDLSFITKIRSFTDDEFKKHFRLIRGSVDMLIEKYKGAKVAPTGEKGGREVIGEDVEIYIFLWYIGNTVNFRQLANLFSVSKSAAWGVVQRVSSWFVTISNEYIRWPTGTECTDIARAFQSMKGIPGVIGAIDGTHIQIKAPRVNKLAYYNRTKYYSLAVQAIVDSNKKFIDIHCGEPGSLDDSIILRRSSIFRAASTNKEALFPNNTFLLGDSAYPSLDWLVPAYKNNEAFSDIKRRFNTLHSSTRMVVENAFGMLKGRFRRIQFFTQCVDLSLCSNLIISACILHNICIENSDIDEEANNIVDIEDGSLNENTQDNEVESLEQQINNRRETLLQTLERMGIL